MRTKFLLATVPESWRLFSWRYPKTGISGYTQNLVP